MPGKRKQPDWLIEAMGNQKSDVPDQLTVIAVGASGGQPGGNGVQAEFTGTGDNGVVEPHKPTDMVMTDRGPRMIHEGELQIVGPGGRMTVIPADEVSRLSGQDILSKMEMESAQMQATDMDQEPIGGYCSGTGKVRGYMGGTASRVPGYATGTAEAEPIVSPMPSMPTIDLPRKTRTANALDIKPDDGQPIMRTAEADPIVTAMPNTPTVDLSHLSRTTMPLPVDQNTTTDDKTKTRTAEADPIVTPLPDAPTVEFDENGKVIDRGLTRTANADPIVTPMPDAPSVQFDEQGNVIEQPAGGQGDTQPIESPYRQGVDEGYERLRNIMNGQSPVDQAIMQKYLTEMRAGNATDRKALMQRMSTDPNLTEGAKAAALGELQRSQSAAEGSMMRDLSIDAMSRAEDASRDVIAKGMDIEKFDRQLADEDWVRALMYYDPATPDGLATLQKMYVNKFGGPAPDFNVLQEERNYAKRKREQDVAMGDISIEQARTTAERLETALGADRFAVLKDMANSNKPWTEDIGKEFGITEDDYNAMQVFATQAITAADLGITAQQNAIITDMINRGDDREAINAQLKAWNPDNPRVLTAPELEGMRERTNYGMWKTQFDENQRIYGNDQRWQEYNAALARSDWDGAKAAYAKLFPDSPEPSMAQLERDKNFVNDKNEILLEGMRNDLGDAKFTSVQARVDAGLPWSEDIEKEYGVSEDEYKAMYDASPLGERNHRRRIEAAKMLLETPGQRAWIVTKPDGTVVGRYDSQAKADAVMAARGSAEGWTMEEGSSNAAQAAQFLNEAFPGMDIDFSQVVNDQNAQAYTTAMGEMAQYISGSKMTKGWDDVPDSWKENWKKTTGMEEDELALMYESMRVTDIDAAWQNFKNNDVYKDMDPKQQEAWDMIYKAGLTGELLIDVEETGKYYVRGEDGTIVGTYDSEEDAQKNAGAGQTVEPQKTLSFKDPTTNLNISGLGNGDGDGPYVPPSPGGEGGTGSGAQTTTQYTIEYPDGTVVGTYDTESERDEVLKRQQALTPNNTWVKGTTEQEITVPVGGLFIDPSDGQIYRKTTEGKRSENPIDFDAGALKGDTEYAWNTDMDDILAMGPELGGWQYEKVLNARIEDVTNGDVKHTELKGPGDPVYDEMIKVSSKWSNVGKWSDDGNSTKDFVEPPPNEGVYFVTEYGNLARSGGWKNPSDLDAKLWYDVYNPNTERWEARVTNPHRTAP